MCGFVVIYNEKGSKLDLKLLELMTNTMQQRGPDDCGFGFVGSNGYHIWHKDSPGTVTLEGVAMGHRRLSILDLSPAGRQPLVSGDNRFWMVYNGEIYNYLELRQELSSLGYTFETKTDTEVLLTAYEHWGMDFINRLNGMWAFVIWDNEKKTLLASRDRFGIKPLYYYQGQGQWIFASEVKAILQHPLVQSKPNERSVFNFLVSGLPPEKGDTYFQDIKAVQPARYILIKNGRAEEGIFWHLPESGKYKNESDQDLSTRFLELFKDAVRLRLRSDVKVGTMLSGGLDSTSIAKMINELLSENVAEALSVGGTQKVFTACFPGTALDETDRVDDLSRQLELNITKIFPTDDDVSRVFPKVVYHMEAPFSKSTPIVQYLLMHRAHSERVKVVLNGHGADEMLGGYSERYCPLMAAEAFMKLRFIKGFKEIQSMNRLGMSGFYETAYSLLCIAMPRMASAAKELIRYKKNNLFNKELGSRYPILFPFARDKLTNGSSALKRRLKQEFFYELLPVWLEMEDKISMSASVESRLPFMDYRVVEFAFQLEDSQKIRDGVTKYIVRNAMQGRLPMSIIHENRKYTFSGPQKYWLRNQLKPLLLSFFIDQAPLISRYIDPKGVRELLLRFLGSGKCDDWDEQFIWRCLNAEVLMRTFFHG